MQTLEAHGIAQGRIVVEEATKDEVTVSGVIRETIQEPGDQVNPAALAGQRAVDVLVPNYSTFTLGDLDAALDDFNGLLQGRTELRQRLLLEQRVPLLRTRSIEGIAFVTQVNREGAVLLRPSSAKEDREARTFFAESALPLETLGLLRPNQQVRITCTLDSVAGKLVWLNCAQITPL